jgi:hypothetical protein
VSKHNDKHLKNEKTFNYKAKEIKRLPSDGKLPAHTTAIASKLSTDGKLQSLNTVTMKKKPQTYIHTEEKIII